jgi:hypothetical protein
MRTVTIIIAVILVVLGIVRLLLGDKYPFKVRGKIIDSLLYFLLAIGIFYLAITIVDF